MSVLDPGGPQPETLLYTTWQDWVERAESEQRLRTYAPGDTAEIHPKVTKAEMAAIEDMESWLRKRGYVVPLDAPLQENVRQHLLSLGMEFLTLNAENIPDGITRNAKNARDFFKDVSKGFRSLVDVDTQTQAGSGDVGMFHSRRELVFDDDDPQAEGTVRRPKL